MLAAIEQHQLLMQEAQKWVDHLKSYGEIVNGLKTKLYQWAAGKTNQDVLKEIEHYHNQFHIQLYNIHDMKHVIRRYILETSQHPDFAHRIPHHRLEEDYQFLIKNIDTLKTDFINFISE